MQQTDPDLVDALVEGTSAVPFRTLGIHPLGRHGAPGIVVRAFLPDAHEVAVAREDALHPMHRIHPEGFFELVLPEDRETFPYQLVVTKKDGSVVVTEDPYRFRPVLQPTDVIRLARGQEFRLDKFLGAHPATHEGVEGVLFAVWAPHALRVGVIGSFNRWEGRRHPMRRHGDSGIWEIFIPGLWVGALYKFEILTRHEGKCTVKADPVSFAMELRPSTASIVWDLEGYNWGDDAWMTARPSAQRPDRPLSIYEVHLGSWRRAARSGGSEPAPFLSYDEIADQLIPYARDLGFTHLELLPMTEHPYDGSWGYQTVGYFAPTSRFGMPDDFRRFVDRAHQAGLGVILDWVPGHFPKDAHGLGYFDGTHLYEHADPRRGVHQDWGTYIYNFGKPQVAAFLISSALFWLDRYHVDGLRVDAVASMLYLDYSRKPGEWIPNERGGRENLEAVAFLKQFNEAVHRQFPGVLTFAEESTSWPGVTAQVSRGGLGFDYKWNMGWMNDSLAYMKQDPLLRKGMQKNLTFSLHYAFHERFLLPLSHDEVVHGKRSLISKMPGTPELQMQNLRALLCWQFLHPGKKLLFMGGEFGQWREWNFDGELEWGLLEEPEHRDILDLTRALNRLYQASPALYEVEDDWRGFEWIDFTDSARSVVSFLRRGVSPDALLVVVLNFTPVEWNDVPVGMPRAGAWEVIFDSSKLSEGRPTTVEASASPLHEQVASARLRVPPLGAIVLQPVAGETKTKPAPSLEKPKSSQRGKVRAETSAGEKATRPATPSQEKKPRPAAKSEEKRKTRSAPDEPKKKVKKQK